MKKKNFLAVSLAATVTLTTICSCIVKTNDDNDPSFLKDSDRWGAVVTDSLSGISALTAIDNADANADVHYEQGPQLRVEIEANEKVRADHRVYMDGSTLVLKPARDNIQGNRPTIVVRVTSPSLRSITTSGTGDVKLKLPVNFDNDLDITSSGTGDVEVHALTLTGKLQAETSGTGDVEIGSATCASARLTSSGTGDVDIENLACEGDVSAETSGTGDIDLHVRCNDLFAEASGTGDIDIDVDCNEVRAEASGTGDIELSGKAKRLVKDRSGLSHIRSKELKVKDVTL